MTTFRVIGPGRAGRSMMAALDATGDFESRGALGRHDPPHAAAAGVDLLVIATPDDQVRRVAASVVPVETTVVIHLAGSLGLDVLGTHPRRGSVHPLVPLPTAATGADRLRSGLTFAVAGDPMTGAVVASLGGRLVTVEDSRSRLVPRGGVHRRQPHGGSHRPGRAGGGLGRAAARRLCRPDAGRPGRRRGPRAPAGTDRARGPRGLGHGGAAPAGALDAVRSSDGARRLRRHGRSGPEADHGIRNPPGPGAPAARAAVAARPRPWPRSGWREHGHDRGADARGAAPEAPGQPDP